MKNILKKVQSIQQNNNIELKSDVSILNNVDCLNHLAMENVDEFRLSAGAKRMLILKRLDACENNKDFIALMKLLNDIDAAEDRNGNRIKDNNLTIAWSSASDAEVVKSS